MEAASGMTASYIWIVRRWFISRFMNCLHCIYRGNRGTLSLTSPWLSMDFEVHCSLCCAKQILPESGLSAGQLFWWKVCPLIVLSFKHRCARFQQVLTGSDCPLFPLYMQMQKSEYNPRVNFHHTPLCFPLQTLAVPSPRSNGRSRAFFCLSEAELRPPLSAYRWRCLRYQFPHQLEVFPKRKAL